MTQDQPLVIPEMSGGEIKFPEPKAPEPEQTPEPAAQPAPQPTAETPEAKPAEPAAEPAQEDLSDEAIWQRVVASDPHLRAMYMQQQYGQAQGQPQNQPVAAQPEQAQMPQAPAEPPAIDFENFDITNPKDLMSLFQHVAAEQNKPLLEYVQHLQQQEQEQANQMAQQQTMEMEKGIHKMVDSHVPGFSEFASKDPGTLTDSQLIVRDAAISLFAREMSKYPQQAWGSVRLQQEVMKKVGPKVKAFADTAGLNRSGDPVAAAEMHVQPSAARSASNSAPNLSNLFEKAYGEGDKQAQVKYTNALFDAMNQIHMR